MGRGSQVRAWQADVRFSHYPVSSQIAAYGQLCKAGMTAQTQVIQRVTESRVFLRAAGEHVPGKLLVETRFMFRRSERSQLSTVDTDRCPGHVGGNRREQHRRHAAKLIRLANSAERDVLRGRITFAKEMPHAICDEQAEEQRVDPNVPGAELVGKTLCQHGQAEV